MARRTSSSGVRLPSEAVVWACRSIRGKGARTSSVDEERLETVPCPYCRGIILVGAKRCKYCQVDLAGLWPKEGTDRGPTKNPLLATVLSLSLIHI